MKQSWYNSYIANSCLGITMQDRTEEMLLIKLSWKLASNIKVLIYSTELVGI